VPLEQDTANSGAGCQPSQPSSSSWWIVPAAGFIARSFATPGADIRPSRHPMKRPTPAEALQDGAAEGSRQTSGAGG